MSIIYLPDKEEKVIAVKAPVRLKEEVSDEEVRPVSRVPGAREPGVLQILDLNVKLESCEYQGC